MSIILASQSPRRRELLGLFGFPFEVRVADVDETMDESKCPRSEVARVSSLKAHAIAAEHFDTVIAADTVVVCDGKILGKPRDAEDAKAMLRMLSGRKHQVITGLTVLRHWETVNMSVTTDVYFRPLSEEEICRYVASGEPMDKAGSYGIQGGGALFVEKIVGDYYNVMGLPVCTLWKILNNI